MEIGGAHRYDFKAFRIPLSNLNTEEILELYLMSDASAVENPSDKGNQVLFWGCFVALITTSFAFFTRMYLCDVRFGADFGIGKVTIGELKGAGVWPFAISIILFSLIIDRIGYRVAMLFSFICYAVYMVMACMAYGAIQGVEGDALAAAQLKGYSLLYCLRTRKRNR